MFRLFVFVRRLFCCVILRLLAARPAPNFEERVTLRKTILFASAAFCLFIFSLFALCHLHFLKNSNGAAREQTPTGIGRDAALEMSTASRLGKFGKVHEKIPENMTCILCVSFVSLFVASFCVILRSVAARPAPNFEERVTLRKTILFASAAFCLFIFLNFCTLPLAFCQTF